MTGVTNRRPGNPTQMRTMSRPNPFSLSALLLVTLAACSGAADPASTMGEAYVRGEVEGFMHHGTASMLHVSGGPGSRESCGINATVDAETEYFRRVAAGEVEAE